MKHMPPIGSRVKYRSEVNGRIRECTGTVRAHYPGLPSHDENDDPYMGEDSAGVQVDEPLPDWWAYDRNPQDKWYARFAPPISELEPTE